MSIFSILKKISKSNKPPACTAVIAAAGSSQRCQGEDKLFYPVNGRPILSYTLEVFQKCDLVNDIIVVAKEDKLDDIASICSQYGFNKVSGIIKGGLTRTQSVLNGVLAVSRKTGIIAIHDGARPCLDADILINTIKKATTHHAVAPAIPVTSTLKKVTDGVISETVDREGLYEIQTPQVFQADLIKAALTNALNKSIQITDDCMAVEIIGMPINIVDGSFRNIKITCNDDFYIAEYLLTQERD
jgi:2-C-methyl-D-erythritol 4-phosphate cytidylyltransferase